MGPPQRRWQSNTVELSHQWCCRRGVSRLDLGHSRSSGTSHCSCGGNDDRLRHKLPDVATPVVLRLGIGGHLGAGRQLARAVVRVWWPVAALGSLLSPRVRRVSGAAIVWTVLASGERTSRRGAGIAR